MSSTSSSVSDVHSDQTLDSFEPFASPVVSETLDSFEPFALPPVVSETLDSSEPFVPPPVVSETLDSVEPFSSGVFVSDAIASRFCERCKSLLGTSQSSSLPNPDPHPAAPPAAKRQRTAATERTPVPSATPDPQPGTSRITDPQPGTSRDPDPQPGTSRDPDTQPGTFTGSTKRRRNLYAEEIRARWNFFRIFALLGTVAQGILFAEERGLVPVQKRCWQHRTMMYIDNSTGVFGMFRCRKNHCRVKSISRTIGTWFENVKIPITLIYKLMYCFAYNKGYEEVKTECKTDDHEGVLSSATIADWYNYCREAVVEYQLHHQQGDGKIGGPGRVVQIDESKFGKRKYNRGRQVEGHWVLGMIEDKSDDLRVEVCPDNERSAEVLVPLIQKHVNTGSILHTDYWRAYDCLPNYGYVHKKVNHSDPVNKFVAPDGTHTQRIESHWRVLKSRFNKDNYKGDFGNWLIEYQWRRNIALNYLDPFEKLIDCVKYVYKV